MGCGNKEMFLLAGDLYRVDMWKSGWEASSDKDKM